MGLFHYLQSVTMTHRRKQRGLREPVALKHYLNANVAPLASVVHAGPAEVELILTFRSVFNGREKHITTQH